MKILSLDISTHTGWALFQDKKLFDFGLIEVKVEGLNFKPDPSKSPLYPKNILTASHQMSSAIWELILQSKPDLIVIENTVKGRNRHYQRCLEFFHKDLLDLLMTSDLKFKYLDPSEWKKKVQLRLSKEDKKNNRDVSIGKKRGRITSKHLSVRFANKIFNLDLKQKDNNQADALLLGWSEIIEG